MDRIDRFFDDIMKDFVAKIRVSKVGNKNSGWTAARGHVPGSQGGDKGSQIGSMKELIDLVQRARQDGTELYVRWSDDIETDIEQEYSYNFDTEQLEAGISVWPLDELGDYEDYQIASQAVKYQGTGGDHAYIVRGEDTGSYGGDGEPLLRDVQSVGRLSEKVIEEGVQINKIREQRRSYYIRHGDNPEGLPTEKEWMKLSDAERSAWANTGTSIEKAARSSHTREVRLM